MTAAESIRELLIGPRRNLALANGERWVWLVATPDNDMVPELDPDAEPYAPLVTDAEADPLWDWLHEERSMNGWDCLLGTVNNWRVEDRDVTWLLQQGVAPGQPFLVHCAPPIYLKYWTDCGYEYDVEYDCEVVAVVPWPRDAAAQAWQAWIDASYWERLP